MILTQITKTTQMEEYLKANNIQFKTKEYISYEGKKVVVVFVDRKIGKPIRESLRGIEKEFDLCYLDSEESIGISITKGWSLD